MANPTHKSPERAFTLQKYLILHSQHDALQKHLNSIASSSASSASSSTSPSPDYAPHQHPPRHHQHPSSILSTNDASSTHLSSIPERPKLAKRRSSLPSTLTVPQVSAPPTEPNLIREEKQKLLNVNQQIKTTLTELLNCESVRTDRKYRMWIQSRLMDAEHEIKSERSRSAGRRRSVDFAI